MDPQQRLLLETAWEALEDGGIPPEACAGTNTGVFIGVSGHEYYDIQLRDLENLNAYTNLGGQLSIAANRLSYVFNFHGPSFAVDTACSSALVAVHLACQSLRTGECTMALVGGMNTLLKPDMTIGFSKASMLSPDGRCWSFDARANGYVRGEGGGIVVLKPLEAALQDGNQIYAVIQGSAINEDGRTDGITVPSAPAQEAMLRTAYRRAGVNPSRVGYVEAHGTGTSVGDPIEAKALGRVFSEGRPPDEICLMGSVKTNIGHLESASGIASLIKVALILKYGMIPRTLHFQTPNPQIPFETLQLRVPSESVSWPPNGSQPRIAGVNAFGFGGANAHIVIGEAPSTGLTHPDAGSVRISPVCLVPLSARSLEALHAVASSFRAFIKGTAHSLSDIGYSASHHRGHHDHRLTVVASSKEELASHLEAFLSGEPRPSLATGQTGREPLPPLAFVFTGMGPQWWGMGRQLFEQQPVFREVIEQCDALLQPYTDWSLIRELMADEASSRMSETQIAQPANFALQAALTAVWRAWGVEPAMVVGHSVGEIAAGYVSGALTLDDAIRVIYHRSRLQQQTAGQGTMLALGIPPEEVAQWPDLLEERVSIGAINSPHEVTLAGDAEVLKNIEQVVTKQGRFARFLKVEVPYHSPKMDPLQDELLRSLRGIAPRSASVPLYSTVTGQLAQGSEWTADYWWHNVRDPVRFADAISSMAKAGGGLFLEVGPHPVLATYIQACLNAGNHTGRLFRSLRRGEQDGESMTGAFGALYTAGYPVDWRRMYPEGRRFVRLPSYPWQRERHWQESGITNGKQGFPALSVSDGSPSHPLLGRRMASAHQDTQWMATIDVQKQAYLEDHQVQGGVVYPGAAYVEMALTAASAFDQVNMLEDLVFEKMLVIREKTPPVLQCLVDTTSLSFELHSLSDPTSGSWIRHAVGRLGQSARKPAPIPLQEISSRCDQEWTAEACYAYFRQIGFEYGPGFQGITHLQTGDKEAVGSARIPEPHNGDTGSYTLHPILLDASFQMMIVTAQIDKLYLPVRIDRLYFYQSPGETCRVQVTLTEHTPTRLVGDIRLTDAEGQIAVEIRGFTCQAVETALTAPSRALHDELYAFQWVLQPQKGDRTVYPPADYMPSPHELAKTVEPDLIQWSARNARERYYQEAVPAFDALCRAYILDAFHGLGWADRWRTLTDADFGAAGVTSHYRLLVRRLVQSLEDLGEGEVVNPQAYWPALMKRFPDCYAELMLFRRCGEHLAKVLSGDLDPLELLFADGAGSLTEHLYQDSPMFRLYNYSVQRVVTAVLKQAPPDRTIRILEVGAGTGGLTGSILAALPADRVEYVFTDISAAFFQQASQRFQAYPFVRYQVLDIGQDPLIQGFDPHSFDMVLASDALHVTPDLRATMASVQQLLLPKGLAILLELTNMPGSYDIVMGLLPGWWSFTDEDIRSSHPWVASGVWRRVFEETGYADIAVLAEPAALSEPMQSVLIGQAPDRTDTVTTHREAPTESAAPCLLFLNHPQTRSGRAGAALCERWRVDGIPFVTVTPGMDYEKTAEDAYRVQPENAEDMGRMLNAILDSHTNCGDIVHLWSLDIDQPGVDGPFPLDSCCALGVMSVMALVQALKGADRQPRPRLYLVTGGVHGVGESVAQSVEQAPLWGLGRVLANEEPGLQCVRIDLSTTPLPDELAELDDILRSDDTEDEWAIRGTTRYVNRLRRFSVADRGKDGAELADGCSDAFQLAGDGSGLIDHLSWQSAERRAPGSDKIAITVVSTGLNFKDVAKAMKLLGEESVQDTFSGWSLGLECAGTVNAVGAGVEAFKIGDRVMALAQHSFGSHVVTDARLAAHIPAPLTFEEASGIPIVFLTAHYSLHHLGRLRPGERVLIHAATGGVGLAAIQMARRVGAEIFATAGSSEKRAFLKAIGIRHIMDSRSTAFADEIMEITEGQGVDVVLNSLAGETLSKSFGILKPFGRFIELGKRDIEDNTRLGLRPFQQNLSFFAVDMDRLIREQPDFTQHLLGEVMAGFSDGSLYALPHRMFPASRVVNAFRYMAQARQVGKVSVDLMDPAVRVTTTVDLSWTCRADGTYLITGGLGGFGLSTAQWLAARGARHLVLLGRSGASSPAAREAIRVMEAEGVTIRVEAGNVSDDGYMAALFEQLRTSMPPLRGVIHAANVYDDAPIYQLTAPRVRTVLQPKVSGAWNLHTQTMRMDLDFFVLYSSITTLVGNPGQGNYVAANAFMDTLAHYRRSLGLPALSLNFGPLQDVGYIVQQETVGDHLKHLGYHLLPVHEALEALGACLMSSAVQAAPARIDWPRWALMHAAGDLPRYQSFVASQRDSTAAVAAGGTDGALRTKLDTTAANERRMMLKEHLHDQVARVLGTASDKLDDSRSFTDLGLDSLMAVELISRLEAGLQLSIPVMLIWQHPSVAQLTDYFAQKLDIAEDTRTPAHHEADTRPDLPRQASVGQTEAEPETPAVALPTPDWSVAPLVEIQAHGNGRPFFCVTAGYGDLFMFIGLANKIGKETPFYLLQPPQRNGEMAFREIKTLVACFIREIRAVQPEGPYRIGGYSAGGLPAYEIAQQLQKQGHAVEHLILMDVPCGYSLTGFALYRALQRSVSTCFPRISGTSSRTLRILQALFLDEGLTEMSLMFRRYKPTFFAGHLLLLQARWSHLRLTRARYLWKKRAGKGLDVYLIPGTHDSFLRTNAKTAADYLKKYV